MILVLLTESKILTKDGGGDLIALGVGVDVYLYTSAIIAEMFESSWELLSEATSRGDRIRH